MTRVGRVTTTSTESAHGRGQPDRSNATLTYCRTWGVSHIAGCGPIAKGPADMGTTYCR